MKKNIIIVLIAGLFVCFTAIGFAAIGFAAVPQHTKPSDYKIGVSYSEAVKGNKPIIALFYVDWCGYCMKFMPKYKIINDLYKYNYSVVMLNAEDVANKNLVADVSLTGFPTVYILDPKYDNRILLNNAIYGDLKKFRVELDRYIRIRKILDSAK